MSGAWSYIPLLSYLSSPVQVGDNPQFVDSQRIHPSERDDCSHPIFVDNNGICALTRDYKNKKLREADLKGVLADPEVNFYSKVKQLLGPGVYRQLLREEEEGRNQGILIRNIHEGKSAKHYLECELLTPRQVDALERNKLEHENRAATEF
ncbi:MAG: hypothetical protein Q9159_001851 [Coniocarpon cinnabarinum]